MPKATEEYHLVLFLVYIHNAKGFELALIANLYTHTHTLAHLHAYTRTHEHADVVKLR